MIKKIHKVVKELFNKETKSIQVSECTADICKLFAKYINETEMDMIIFDGLLFDILEKYKNQITDQHWTFVKMIALSSAAIPYKVLWDLFVKEQKKHCTDCIHSYWEEVCMPGVKTCEHCGDTK